LTLTTHFHKNKRGVEEKLKEHILLYIDQMIPKEAKQRARNISMAWIDYKKAYDMIPHSWITECLEMFGVNENIRKLLGNSMKTWRVELT